MKFVRTIFAAFFLWTAAFAQEPKSVTVPITLDHNRIVIDVYLPLPDGNTKRVRALVDTGATEMTASQRVGEIFGPIKCDAQTCETTLPPEIQIGGMKISLERMQTAHAPAGVPTEVMVAGMSPESHCRRDPAQLRCRRRLRHRHHDWRIGFIGFRPPTKARVN
jgi:hypothetical protein